MSEPAAKDTAVGSRNEANRGIEETKEEETPTADTTNETKSLAKVDLDGPQKKPFRKRGPSVIDQVRTRQHEFGQTIYNILEGRIESEQNSIQTASLFTFIMNDIIKEFRECRQDLENLQEGRPLVKQRVMPSKKADNESTNTETQDVSKEMPSDKRYSFTKCSKCGNFTLEKPTPEQKKNTKDIFSPQNRHELRWEHNLTELAKLKKEQGNFDFTDLKDKNPKLLQWIERQRSLYKQNKLADHRVKKLEELKFKWKKDKGDIEKEKERNDWDLHFEMLAKYKYYNGHCDIPKDDEEHPQLAKWLHQQFEHKFKFQLSKSRAESLELLGVVWPKPSFMAVSTGQTPCYSWEYRYGQLQAYKKKYGNVNIHPTYDTPLFDWMKRQCRHKKYNTLSKQRLELLDSIGFDWKWPMQSFRKQQKKPVFHS